MEFKDIAGFVAFAGGLGVTVEHANRHILEISAKAIEDEAKRVIGTYDYDWKQLSPATQADRVRQGFPANEPLLRTGELRDSIEHKIIDDHHAEVGSNSDIAVYQELGTANIPPRSFLAQAAMHKEKQIRKIAGELWHAALLPHALNGVIARIAYDALHSFAHSIKEDIEDLTNPNSSDTGPPTEQIHRGAEHVVGHIVRSLKE